MSFEETKATIERRVAAERSDPRINPLCVTQLLDHGRMTDRAIVLFHGVTNCPYQYRVLARRFFDLGYNVYIPLLPHHGFRDRLTPALADLTAAELKQATLAGGAIAAGLGRTVDALGISLGGVMAAWLAQSSAIGTALAIAPFFQISFVPGPLSRPATAVLAALPNFFVWWDPRLGAKKGPDYCYPRVPTHALSAILQLGQSVNDLAAQVAPPARRCILVTNSRDPAVANAAAHAVWSRWQSHGGDTREVTLSDVPPQHDIMDPTNYPAADRLVYPVLTGLMTPPSSRT